MSTNTNLAGREAWRARMEREDWEPTFSHWRHGGSYVDNVVFPSGAVGCVASAAHTISRKFESACFPLGTFKTRREAAFGERAEALRQWRALDAMSKEFPWRHEDDWLNGDYAAQDAFLSDALDLFGAEKKEVSE